LLPAFLDAAFFFFASLTMLRTAVERFAVCGLPAGAASAAA